MNEINRKSEKGLMNILLATLLALATAFALGACNTVHGVGEDVEAVGEGVQKASDEVSEEIDEEFDD